MSGSAINSPTPAPNAPGACSSCGSPHLRRAKTREDDWPWMLLLQWPVRCMTCLKRMRIPMWRARHAIPASVAHSGKYAATGTWQELEPEPKPENKEAA